MKIEITGRLRKRTPRPSVNLVPVTSCKSDSGKFLGLDGPQACFRGLPVNKSYRINIFQNLIKKILAKTTMKSQLPSSSNKSIKTAIVLGSGRIL